MSCDAFSADARERSTIRQKFAATGGRTIAHFSADLLERFRKFCEQGGEK